MKKNDPIKHIMSTDLITVASNGTFSAAKNALEENKIHHVPVLNGKTLEGVISRVDILKFSYSKAFMNDDKGQDTSLDHTVTLSDVMTKDVVTINENENIKAAAEILNKYDFNCLPVVNSSSELVGMVTSKDIMGYLLEQY